MEHVNGWCFRGIYKVGLWENDLHVSARTDTNTVVKLNRELNSKDVAHDTGDTSLKRASCVHVNAIKGLFFNQYQQMIHQTVHHAIN